MSRNFWLMVLMLVLLSGSAALAQTPRATAKPAAKPTDAPAAPKNAKQMLAPTLVTLECNKETVTTAVAALEKQIGQTVTSKTQPVSDSPQRITCSHVNQPMWKVVADVAAQGKMEFVTGSYITGGMPFILSNSFSSDSRIFAIPRTPESSILPAITGLSYDRKKVGETWMADATRITINLQLLTEPKAFVAAYHPSLRVTAASDATGSLIIEETNPAPRPTVARTSLTRQYQAVVRDSYPHLHVRLRAPGNQTIKRLAGDMRVVLGFDLQTVDLTPALQGKETRVPLGRKDAIVFTGLLRNEQHYELNYTMPQSIPGVGMVADAMEFRAMRIVATDADGRTFHAYNSPRLSVMNNQIRGMARLSRTSSSGPDDLKPPVKATCVMPTRLEEATIPFEFVDLTIPAPR